MADDRETGRFGQRAPGKPVPAVTPPDRAATKRSQTVSTVLVAGAGLAALGLGSLDRTPYDDVLVYADAAACAAEAIRTPEACRSAYATARAAYPRTAPHYEGLSACEGHHGPGHCETDAGEPARPFVPRMAGYLIGRDEADGVTPEPVYEHRTGGSHHGYCTGSGSKISSGWGGSGSSGKVKSTSATSATKFGGFGNSGRGFSGFGG